jgi:hypothetical protein
VEYLQMPAALPVLLRSACDPIQLNKNYSTSSLPFLIVFGSIFIDSTADLDRAIELQTGLVQAHINETTFIGCRATGSVFLQGDRVAILSQAKMLDCSRSSAIDSSADVLGCIVAANLSPISSLFQDVSVESCASLPELTIGANLESG